MKPKSHPLRIDEDVYWELDEAYEWYTETRSVERAEQFLEDYQLAIERIRQFPEGWPPYSELTRRCPLLDFPYNVFYSVEPDHLYIAAVSHNRRRPGYWLDRVKRYRRQAGDPTPPKAQEA